MMSKNADATSSAEQLDHHSAEWMAYNVPTTCPFLLSSEQPTKTTALPPFQDPLLAQANTFVFFGTQEIADRLREAAL